MKKTTLAVAVAATMALAHSAQAHEHHHRHFHRHIARSRTWTAPQWNWTSGGAFAWQPQNYSQPERSGFSERQIESYPQHTAYGGGGLGHRPAAWCGWEMRQLVGGDPGPSYNLARNWAHWGRAGAAGVGAIVVWPHHVGKIVGQQNGQWVIESGNDGHALRTRPRSIAGAIAIRWG
ncbi:MAG TPA: hypothetical protein VMC05_16105 [Xanthobacteraceae bacterium]|nr:hypothetical protein [Xanthobacteraceae bacterium]